MTSKNEKLRGLFLAAIMVTSVFVGSIALTGTVAAANQPTVDSAVEYDGNIEIAFDRDVDEVDGSDDGVDGSNVTVYVGDTQYDLADGDLAGTDSQVIIDRADIGASDIDPTTDVKVNLPDLEESGAGADDVREGGNVTVDVTSRVIEEGEDETTRRTYQGEVVALQADSPGDDIVIEEVGGGIQLDGGAATNGQLLTYDTEDLESGGNYSVEFEGAAQDEYFQVNDLQFDASVESTELTEGDDIVVDVSAVRGNSDVTVEVDGPEDSTVESSQTKTLGGNGEATFTFATEDNDDPNTDVGDYDITATDDSTGVSDTTDTVTVSEAADTDVSFGEIEGDQRGDVANITLDLTNSDFATIQLGTDNDAFVSNVTVEDTDGDGTVTLQWNTFVADDRAENNNAGGYGADSLQWSATSGEVTGTNVSTEIVKGPSHIIASGTYEMEAVASSDVADLDDSDAVATVTLESRDTSSAQLWTAPAGASVSDLSDVSAAVEAGTLTQDTEIATGDFLVAEINAEGLEGAFENQTALGLSDTNAWLNMTGNQTVYLNHTENIGSSSNQSPTEINIGDNENDVSVIADADGDTYYVLANTDDLDVAAGESFNTEVKIPAQSENQANFGLVAPNANGNFPDETVETGFDVVTGTASIDTAASGDVEVRAQDNQTITGTSTYAPGTDIRVRVQSQSGSSSQFIIGPRDVTVTEDGTWSLEADYSSYNVGSTFDVTANVGGTEYEEEGVIRGAPEVLQLNFEDQTTRGEIVRVTDVELNAGGFVAIHQGSASGPVIGASEYIDENDPQQNLRILLDEPLNSSQTLVAMPHQDTNANEEYEFDGGDVDAPYTENGTPVTDSAQVTLEGAAADFQVSNLNPMDVTVTAGDVIDVSATVTNEGGASGTQTVEFRVGGSAIASEEVSLDSGANTTVEFTDIDTSGLEAGDLTHGVYTDDSSQEATLTVESDETPTPTPTPEPSDDGEETATPEPSDDDGDDGEDTETTEGESGPGFGIIVSVLALLGAALLAARRNN